MELRLDVIYDKIDDIECLIEVNEARRASILKDKMTTDNINKVLINFVAFVDVMEDIDKKRLCLELIEKVEIYEAKNEAGRWVKYIHFKLPIIEDS